MTLTPEMQALREAAERATPGKWIAQHEYGGERLTDEDTGNEFSSVLPENGSWPDDVICEVWSGNHLDEPNAKFIAAANPAAILALIASYEALTAENNHAIDSIAQLQEEVLALQARLSVVRKLPNLTNPELMQLGTRTCSVEGEHFLPMKFGRAVINALHDQIEAASVAAQTGAAPAKESALQALVDQAQELDMGYGEGVGNG